MPRKRVERVERPCAECGAAMRVRAADPRRYCSMDCFARARHGSVTCAHCGKGFRPKKSDRRTFCSRECSFAALAEAAKVRQEEQSQQPRPRVACATCGGFFERVGAQRYCSDPCRGQAARTMGRAYALKRHLERAVEVECKDCGARFTPKYGSKRRGFCSASCARRHANRNGKHRRRVRLRKQFVQSVSFAQIFRRDQGLCQLCGGEVLRTRCPTDPKSATLDHIVPLARGGTHEPGNVQLAHRLCNSLKGDRMGPLEALETG